MESSPNNIQKEIKVKGQEFGRITGFKYVGVTD